MKHGRDISKLNNKDAGELCSRIREEASEEAELLLCKAEKERERILLTASEEARIKTQEILQAAEKDIAAGKDRIFSTINMEKKRIYLEAKSLFIANVIEAVKREAEIFRDNKDYIKFLRAAILEGIGIIDDKEAQVLYSRLDESRISQIDNLPVEFKVSDFNDIGVIVQSRDGRFLFDNRFPARLKRLYDEIYVKLLKEGF